MRRIYLSCRPATWDLTLLAPDVQERILFAESVDGVEPMGERAVRAVVNTVDWVE